MCVVRVTAKNFRVDDFLSATTLRPQRVWRTGDVRHLADGRAEVLDTSGVVLSVSDALPDRVAPLLDEIRSFLMANGDQLRRLHDMIQDGEMVLDIAVAWDAEKASHHEHIPADVVALLAEYGLGIELSYYAVSSDQ